MSNDSDEKFPEFNGAWQMNLASFHHEPAFVPPVVKRLARDAETLGEFFHIVQVSAFGNSPHLLDVYLRFVNLDSAGAYEVSEGYERVSLVHAGFSALVVIFLQPLEHICDTCGVEADVEEFVDGHRLKLFQYFPMSAVGWANVIKLLTKHLLDVIIYSILA